MGFFKENLFFVLLAAGVIVISGALLAVNASVGGDDVDELKLKKRLDIAPRLARERQRKGVNPKIVEAEELRVHTTRKDANAVRSRIIDWNSDNCKPLVLPLVDRNLKVVGRVPAFPIDPKKYENYSLLYRFTHEYLKQVELLRLKLNPVTLPKREALDAAIDKWRIHIAKKAKLDAASEEGKDELDGDAEERRRPDMGTGGEDQATVFARRELMRRQARKGWMYVHESAMEKVFPIATTTATAKQIWEAQLNLWVTADIVEAIVTTNKDVFAKLPNTEGNVSSAAVKRLMNVTVERDYYTGRSSGFSSYGGPDQTSAMGLTGRTLGMEYDVLHYSFSVIMSKKHLLSLQRNLLKRNLHTILKVDAAAVAFNENEMYYYGADPVVQVTMACELLLLTAWERGSEKVTAGAKGRARTAELKRHSGEAAMAAEPIEWQEKFPALMPLDVLRWIQTQASQALRDVDRRRLVSARN